MNWMKCGDCHHVFTDGYFTEDALKVVFSRTLPEQTIGYKVEPNRVVSARMIEKVLPYQSQGRWMDIGAGNGSLLFTAQEYGFFPVGVDLRQSTINLLRQLGFEGYCCDFQSLVDIPKFNVISAADVLEHMPFPKKALTHIHRLLVDGGVALISMPNMESFIWQLTDQTNSNPYWGEMEHYHNFSRTRLYKLLEETGFKPVRYSVSERYRMCMEIVAVKQ